MAVVELRDDRVAGDYEGQDDRIGLVMARKVLGEHVVVVPLLALDRLQPVLGCEPDL